jgi:hypothetical protein
MEKVIRYTEASRMSEEYKIVEKKLIKANESLKDITIEQIREVLAQAEKKGTQ